MSALLDVLGGTLLLVGAGFVLVAALGVLRLPDLLSRMHAATKPQVIGLLLALAGTALTLRQPAVLGLLVLVALTQMATSVVASHMVARAAYRAGHLRRDLLVVDELEQEQTPDWREPRGAP